MPEIRIPRKKSNMKLLATLPPRKYPIPNQDINTLGIKKDQSLPPHLPKFCPVYKQLIYEADDDRHDYTNTSHTDKEDSIDNLKAMNNKKE